MDSLKSSLSKFGQDHLLTFYNTINPTEQKSLEKQLSGLDYQRLSNIFTKATSVSNEQQDIKLEPFPKESFDSLLTASNDALKKWYDHGLKLIADNKVAVILLAGGQGTRLGSSDPKGCYDIGLPSKASLFELQGKRLLKLQQLAEAVGKSKVTIPWYVMTSGPTRGATESFFKKNGFFGLDEKQVVFFEQGVLPAFTPQGKIILETKSSLSVAPDGNGGIYAALRNQGILNDLKKKGIPYIHVYCVDNCLVKIGDPTFIGFCVDKRVECGAKVVPKRSPEESVGIICLKNGKYSAVEYSEIDKESAYARGPDGTLVYNTGNIANHFFTLDFLDRIKDFESELEYHVASKKIKHVDLNTGEVISPSSANGIKLELFIFDVFPFAKSMAVLEVERAEEFSPLKNANGADSPETSRADIMAQHVRFIERSNGIVIKKEGPSICELSPMVTYGGEGLEGVAGVTVETPCYISSKAQLDELASRK